MTIITKGMGAILQSSMKKAGVTKPTFPGPNAHKLLNKKVQKLKKEGMKSQDVMESYAGVDSRISKSFLRGFKPGKK